jgi:hypothetical protein
MGQPNYLITEEVIDIEIANGASVGTVSPTTNADGSRVIQAVIYYNGTADAPIQAGIRVDNKDISPMQHINNYRSRDCQYLANKPCNFESGKRVYLEVRTSGAFTSDFTAQLILIKETPCF